jgi:hypothetical protein
MRNSVNGYGAWLQPLCLLLRSLLLAMITSAQFERAVVFAFHLVHTRNAAMLSVSSTDALR